MVSFGKTEDLEPGESVELDLSFPFEELKLVNSAGDEVVLSQTSANYYILHLCVPQEGFAPSLSLCEVNT